MEGGAVGEYVIRRTHGCRRPDGRTREPEGASGADASGAFAIRGGAAPAGEHRQHPAAREVWREVREAGSRAIQPGAGGRGDRPGGARRRPGASRGDHRGQAEGRDAAAPLQPRPAARPSAARGADHRAGEHPLPLRLRRDGQDRRRRLRAARCDSRAVPRAGDAAAPNTPAGAARARWCRRMRPSM